MEQEIRERKGLNPSTLRMWRIKGIIDQGELGPHPIKGRGRVRTYSWEVALKIETIIDLRREAGLSLIAAVAEYEKIKVEVEEKAKREAAAKLEMDHRLSLLHLLKEEKIRLNGETVSAIDFCTTSVIALIKPFVPDAKVQQQIFRQLKKSDLANFAWNSLVAGFNPCVLWDGESLRVMPDFLVAQRLSENFSVPVPYVVAPLHPVFESTFSLMGKEMPIKPVATPAPQIRMTFGGNTVEFDLRLDGSIGFEVDQASGREVAEKTSQKLNK
jgi:DNA-binding transcriptional MerR regulator